jgi:hypothetical protein
MAASPVRRLTGRADGGTAIEASVAVALSRSAGPEPLDDPEQGAPWTISNSFDVPWRLATNFSA